VSAWSIRGWQIGDTQYFYLLYLAFATSIFLTMPARKKDRTRLPWYDLVISAFIFGTFIYLFINAFEIQTIGWIPPHLELPGLVIATILAVVAIESGRRMAGLPFAILCLIVGCFPFFADKLPGVLWGVTLPFDFVMASFAYGMQGMLGLPAQVTGTILIGFLMFAGVLIATGAAKFFLNLALALMGRYRGGPAKVAVIASGFFGSMSGATPANIIATGSVTIPAMKGIGYPPHYAGAIEAVASNGGSIMPPVMGAVAFIMAILTDVPYTTVMIAAILPALLYYWGLLVQVDSYAARTGLKGLPREQLPSLLKTLKEGWHFVFVLVFLVFGLIYMRWGALAPVYSSGLMLAFSLLFAVFRFLCTRFLLSTPGDQGRVGNTQGETAGIITKVALFLLSFTPETTLTPRKVIDILTTVGNLITYIMAVLFPLGLLLMGLQITGSLTSLTSSIVLMAGDNVIYILLIAVAVCYLFGMVGIVLIPYVVLAVIALPAIVAGTGMNLLALHFFLIFYIMTSGITPPVCVFAFIAAALAGARPFKTGFTAMRLAIVLYFIPWFFVFNPALIMQGEWREIIYLFALCLVGIWILGSGLEGYLIKVGRLTLWARVLLVIGGFLIAFPGWQDFNWWMTSLIGAAVTAAVVAVSLIRKSTASGLTPGFTANITESQG
jgi:TRAP transporter 4TM/12TM fusion protein